MITETSPTALSPHKCVGCKTGNLEYRYLDLHTFVEGYGWLLICENCVNTTETLLDRGPLLALRKRNETLEAENERGNRALIALSGMRAAFDALDLEPNTNEPTPIFGTKATAKSAAK